MLFGQLEGRTGMDVWGVGVQALLAIRTATAKPKVQKRTNLNLTLIISYANSQSLSSGE